MSGGTGLGRAGGGLLVTAGPPGSAVPLAAAVAVEAALARGLPVVLAEAGAQARPRRAAILASASARRLEEALRAEGLPAASRGHFCHLPAEPVTPALAEIAEAAWRADAGLVVAAVPAAVWTDALACESLRVRAGLLAASLPRDRSLAALAVAELRAAGCRARVSSAGLSPLAARRALAGVTPGGAAGRRGERLVRGLLGPAQGEDGQALVLVLAAAAALVICALVLAAIGGAVTGKGRAQRAADLAAVSAARSLRDDLPRLLEPARLPDGSPNPRRLPRAEYLARARAAGADAAVRNGVDPSRVALTFPDSGEAVPLQARAEVRAEVDAASLLGGGPADAGVIPVKAAAVAEAVPPGGDWTGMPAVAGGGGYSGTLAYRNGEGMRPDVAAAFDRMAAAARRAGIGLVVNSGFRSDAEQARLFAAHPDPRWVAPPGRSLHRCATELDLGPPSAYGWLAGNARRFGFLQRYSWEAWHYGFVAGPPPCSAAGDSAAADPDGERSSSGVPSFVPGRYREPLMRSAARWNVSAAMLAAQLMAESGFNPRAVSPVGAQGIAQFMPGTAASYGLRDPFDPEAAIDAQAHLMSDLLRRFRSVPLALAAYNAGPGAVAACGCAGPYAETRAYVARILALLDGAGAALAPPLEVRLVR